MDRRIKYLIGIDTETANGLKADKGLDLTQSLPYDIGWQVTDKRANVYLERSFVIAEIFYGMRDVMKSAYYANKIPRYEKDIAEGRRIVASITTVKRIFAQDCATWNVQAIFAYNTRFDLTALNNVIRYITKSEQRYFFPYGIDLWDAMKMVNDTLAKQPSYKRFCIEHGYLTAHKTPRPRVTAEIVTRYLTGDYTFDESHTGLEDVRIEAQILAYCFRQHKTMRKNLFDRQKTVEPWPEILVWKKQKFNMAWG